MKNKWKKIIMYLVIVAVVGGAFYYFVLINKPVNAVFPHVSPPASPVAVVPTATNKIIYTDSGFSPATITIKAGDTVTWTNNSSNLMWVASAIHPSHGVYPTTGGCLGSTFDACKGLEPGAPWSFKFDYKGSWKYHDHLNPGARGTIVVE